MKISGKESKDKWYNNVFLWTIVVFAVIVIIAVAINTNKPNPRLDVIVDKATIEQRFPEQPPFKTTTTLPDKLAFDKSTCERSCITRTHYFSNGTKKLICVPLREMGACEGVDE